MKEEYGKEYFEGENSNFYRGYEWHPDWLIKAKNLQACFNPKCVLVCGCAKGFLVKAFREIEIEAYGLDISNYAITHAPPEIWAFVQLGDVRDMAEYDDNEFDLVTAIDLLEHIPEDDVPQAVSELVRVSNNIIFTRQHLEWNKKARADTTHKTINPTNWWINLFEKYNTKIVDIPDEFMGRSDLPDEDWEDPEHEPFNPHEILVFRKEVSL